jgi:hypothetical protein
MRSYTTPNLTQPIDEIRAEIKRDYEALAHMVQLPTELGFEAAVATTYIGMVPSHAYPFKKFQQDFAEAVARHSGNDEAFNDAFEIVTGVWNYFPHQDLGMSPVELIRKEVAEGGEMPDYEAIRDAELSPEQQEQMFKETDQILIFLSEVAESHLIKHLQRIGCTKKDAQTIIEIIEDPEQDPEMALLSLITKITKRITQTKTQKHRITMKDIQPAMRALAMCENHITIIVDGNHKSSRMMQAIAEQCATHMMKSLAQSKSKTTVGVEIIEPIMPLECLLDVHVSINEVSTRLHVPEGLEEAAHHILDWIMLTDIHEVIAHNDAEEYAAIILAVARLIAETGDPKRPFDNLAPLLRKNVPSITDDTAYAKEVARIARMVLCRCSDPILMMPIPGQEPADCEERLAVLAPDLKFRSSISPNDLSVPSPFWGWM